MSNYHSHEHHDHLSHAHIPQDKKILALSFSIITGFMVVKFVLMAAFSYTGLTVWRSWLMRDTWQMIVYRYF